MTSCSLFKAKERGVTGIEIGEEEQALFSEFMFYIPLPMQIQLFFPGHQSIDKLEAAV